MHIDDGRAFLERTDRTYDTVIFALPDSLTLVAGSGPLRLESYLFTAQALQAVRGAPRAPAASFAMYNSYREPWLVDRYAAHRRRRPSGTAVRRPRRRRQQRGDRRRRSTRPPGLQTPPRSAP